MFGTFSKVSRENYGQILQTLSQRSPILMYSVLVFCHLDSIGCQLYMLKELVTKECNSIKKVTLLKHSGNFWREVVKTQEGFRSQKPMGIRRKRALLSS